MSAARALLKTPGLSAVALLSLAVALGLSTAGFTVIHGAFLAPLPLPHAERLVIAQHYDRAGRFNVPVTAADVTLARERSTAFDGLAAWFSRNVSLESGAGDPAIVRAAHVSPNALALAGIVPARGRLPVESDADPGAAPVILIGDALWRSRFAGDLDVIGRQVTVAGRAHEVIGILPPGIRFPIREDAWIPIQIDARQSNATGEPLTMLGRLAPGTSRSQAAAELATIAMTTTPAAALTPAVTVMPFARGFMSPEQEWAVYAFLGGLLLFVLVIAANVASLFLARNAARAREMALRTALGASRAQLVRLLLRESLILGAVAAVAGVAIARVVLVVVVSEVRDLPWWADFGLTPAVLMFVAATAVLAGVAAGLGPAIRLTRRPLTGVLKDTPGSSGGLRFSRAGAALLAVQLALSVGCLSALGVLAHGLFGFSYARYGIAANDVLVAQVYLGPPDERALSQPGADRREIWQQHAVRSGAELERIRAALAEQPGVRSATVATLFPGNDVESARIEIAGGAVAVTRVAGIGPQFFDVLGVAVAQGRDFTPADRTGPTHAAIVNAPFAAKFFPGRSPLGERIRLANDAGAPSGVWLSIVGVAPDLGMNPGDRDRADGMYLPFAPSNFARLAVNAATPLSVVPALHRLVTTENPRAQIQSAETLAAQMAAAEAVFRGLGAGLLTIGGTALLLSAVSLYALISFAVTRRTREIGVRVALGATGRRVVTGILAREMRVVVIGAVAGVLAGAALSRLVAALPFDVRPATSPLLVAAVGLIAVVGASACLVPAWRALRLSAATALRHE